MPDPKSHQLNVEDLNFLNLAAVNNLYSRVVLEDTSSLEDPGYSTAALPYLPMTITVPDQLGNELSFTLLINPENMNHGKSNAAYYSYTRKGYVTQLWGPNQDLITATGKSAAFYIGNEGLTNKEQRSSLGFHNFISMVAAYRNNGYQILDIVELQSRYIRVINIVPGIKLYYDGQEYLGHFNNFTIDDVAETPFIFNYNFEFVVSSLSPDYSEIRGHFLPLNYQKNLTPERIKLIEEIEDAITPKEIFVQPVEVYDEVDYAPNSYALGSLIGRIDQYDEFIMKYAKEFRVSPNFIKSIMAQETRGIPNLTSTKGAAGLMQIMPPTARTIAARLGETYSDEARYDPETSIRWGTKLLSELLNHYKGNEILAAAAYNAGQTAVDKYKGVPPFPETQAYVYGDPNNTNNKGFLYYEAALEQQTSAQPPTVVKETTDQIVADQKERNANPTPKLKWEADYQQATGVPPSDLPQGSADGQ